MWVSTRRDFRRGDPGWDRYVDFIGLPSLTRVITIDAALNPYADRCGSYLGDVPAGVHGVADSRKVRVIVQNLISNAAKYTETGAITTRVRTDGLSGFANFHAV